MAQAAQATQAIHGSNHIPTATDPSAFAIGRRVCTKP